MAFLNLYLHIFPKIGLRRAIYGLMVFIIAYFLAFVFGTCFNCIPVSYVWKSWTGETTGKCLDFNAFGISCAVLNIVLDVVVMVLPLHEIMKLHLGPMKKFLIMIVFCTGSFVTIVSIIRLKSVVTFANTTNATYDYVPVAYWSSMEAFTAVFCVNMPAIRRLFKRIISHCKGDRYSSSKLESNPYSESEILQQRKLSKGQRHSIGKTINGSASQEPLSQADSDAVESVDVDYLEA
ncbi:Nucleic acid-binding OB-fold [Penicillium herquei]|nr:Nucleic acid-binding OB-fold [Penicillium herquei]